MNRSGYSHDCENLELWRGAVRRAIRGRRGQAFLRGLAEQMDAMPEKRLVRAVGIAWAMAAEIEYENDECGPAGETPEQRWLRMRRWVDEQIIREVTP